MLTLPLLVASVGFFHHVIGSRHQKQNAHQVQTSEGPPIDANKAYLIRVDSTIVGLESACDYLGKRCKKYVGDKSEPVFSSCSSGGQHVSQQTPYLFASCYATDKDGLSRDVSFNAFADSKHTIVFLRSDETIRKVEIDQQLLKIESKKWKPTVHHHPREKSSPTKRHHRQTNHETTGPKTHSSHNGVHPKRHKQDM